MIYVDPLFTATPRATQARCYGNQWCHMTTDSDDYEELHVMAEKIGLRRSYFQEKSSLPHYDLTPAKRALALKYGAQEISTLDRMYLLRIKRVATMQETVALSYMSLYFGVPKYGHERCYKQTGNHTVQVLQDEPALESKICSACGKKLIPESEQPV